MTSGSLRKLVHEEGEGGVNYDFIPNQGGNRQPTKGDFTSGKQ